MKVISAGCICADIFVEENKIMPGGETLNFCGNICGYPGITPCLLSAIGDDEYGKAILQKLSEFSISTDYLKVKSGVTANNKIYHTKSGDRYFRKNSWCGGVYDRDILTDSDIKFIKSADLVHTQFGSPYLRQITECKKSSGFLLAVDFDVFRDFENIIEIISCTDLFFVSGEEKIFPMLQKLSSVFDTIFVSTLAENGSIAFYKNEIYRCDAVKVEKVVDTTGAGDSFQAGFVAEYIFSRDINKSLKSGSECAARNIVKLGGV